VFERLDEQRDLIVALNEQIESLSATVSSADGSVSVQVDGHGAPTGLRLGDAAYRNGADALAREIVKVAHAAAQLVADRQVFLCDEYRERVRQSRNA
jgi:DNA-binding protein YbaB